MTMPSTPRATPICEGAQVAVVLRGTMARLRVEGEIRASGVTGRDLHAVREVLTTFPS